jgi:hypothetical protein
MPRSRACAVTLLLLFAAAGVAQTPPSVTFVPWKVLNPGEEVLKGDLVLFWVPATRNEIKRSPMLTSRPLALFASQCIGMQLVRPEDEETIARLAVEQLPAAVVVYANGSVVARVTLVDGTLRVADVERMVRDALTSRNAAADQLLDDARAKMEAGDRDHAIELYRRVAAQRCLFPRKARDAERALHKLGAGAN